MHANVAVSLYRTVAWFHSSSENPQQLLFTQNPCFSGPGSRQPDSNGNPPSGPSGAVDWDGPLAAFTPQHPIDTPTPPAPTPFSELGGLSGIPKPAETTPAGSGVIAPQQIKAQSAVDATAAQRVAGLAKPALQLIDNALAAGRRGKQNKL